MCPTTSLALLLALKHGTALKFALLGYASSSSSSSSRIDQKTTQSSAGSNLSPMFNSTNGANTAFTATGSGDLMTGKGDNVSGLKTTNGSNAAALGANSVALGSLAGMKGDVTISSVTADPAVAEAAMASMSSVVTAALSANQTTTANTLKVLSSTVGDQLDSTARDTAANNALLSAVMASEQDFARNVQSGGQAGQDQSIVYIVLGAFGLLAAFFLFFKRP